MKNDKTDNHEQIFWEEIDRLFPDMIKAIASLSKKSYLSITNLRTGITWWSERAMDYFGMKENYTIRSMEKANRKIHPDDVATFKRGFKERVDGKNLDTAWEYRIQDGDSYNRFNAMARVLYDEQKQPFIIIIRYDNYGISDEVDSVTGLYTEPALNRCITQLLDNTRPAALLKIGLDQFSHINVMYGAAFADKILNKVAQSLLHMVRNIGYAYRLSGAKFVLVFDKISKIELRDIFNFIEDALANTITVNGKRIPIKISAGAIFLEPYMKETNAVRSRLTYAQNHSRYEHHGDLVIFNDEICGNNEKQFELIGLIHQCATSHFEGFRLFYQPIADTKTGKIRGMEALIRWELEPYGLISPGIFMEWLEEDPCIFDLGNWILRTALKDIGRIRDKIPHFFVNVNISAAQLSRKEFRDSVMTILKETGARPEELCLELTERCRDLDVTFLKNEVNFFHSKGIKIALDDFGTGQSNLNYIVEMPVQIVKFDRVMTQAYFSSQKGRFVMNAAMHMIQDMKLGIVSEGIETQEQLTAMEQLGIDYIQGFYFSKPLPLPEFLAFIKKQECKRTLSISAAVPDPDCPC